MDSVLIVDDHPLVRRGMRELLDDEAQFCVMGEASNGEEALALVAEQEPDVVLLDLNMRGMDGLTTLRTLRAQGCKARVIVLTVSDAKQDVLEILQAGADGYLLKDMEPEQVVEKLTRACRGEVVVDESLASLLAKVIQHNDHTRGQPSQAHANLTRREEQILQLLAEGLSNHRIAEQLDIADGTVKVHVKNILKKLGLHSRLAAAMWAVKNKALSV